MCADDGIPPDEKAYLQRVVETLKDVFKDALLSVFLVGSAAYGQYQPGMSDLDVQAIVADEAVTSNSVRTTAQKLSHSTLPCPARLLEFVLYTETAALTPSPRPLWSLNLNTGATRSADAIQLQIGNSEHGSLDNNPGGSHWFLLDLACARELGRTLYGLANTAQAFAAPERTWVLGALRDCITWFAEADPTNPSAILNACRACRWAADQVWGSKVQGAEWALARRGEEGLSEEEKELVSQAMNLRKGGVEEGLDLARAQSFLRDRAREVARLLDLDSST